jgi:CheY-like chemotaxis protein
MIEQIGTFLADGFRDTAVEALFSAVFTAVIILTAALLSGRWLQRVDVGGLTLEFAAKETEAAYKSRKQPVPSRSDVTKALRDVRGQWSVLWVDDHPEWVRYEMEALSALGFDFRIARTNDQASELLGSHFFHLVISDIGRDEGPSGLEMETIARQQAGSVPLIFYVAQKDAPTTANGNPVVATPQALYKAIARVLTMRQG